MVCGMPSFKMNIFVGIAVIRNVFDKGDIQEIRHALHLKSSLARDAAFKIIETDPNVSALKYTRG